MPRLSQPERDRAIGMLQAGRCCLAVARVFGVHRSTITRLAERYHATGSSNDRPRTGRPRVTTAAQDRANRLAHLRDRFRPATRSLLVWGVLYCLVVLLDSKMCKHRKSLS